METSLPNSNHDLRRSIVDLLWKQWSALGVSGHVTQGGKAAIDPEALVLFSTVFARHDARLFDEVADWLQQNGAWINVLRLTRLRSELELGDPTVLGALAEHMMKDTSHSKWKVLAKHVAEIEKPVPLFPHLMTPNQEDEIFRRWGWLRPKMERRGLSRPPRPNQPASFLLKLRALFGRQSRAEVFAWLLSHESGHPAQIARETGYFRGSVQNVLNELEISGHVFATREGREKHFVLKREQWRFLLTWSSAEDTATAFPPWVPWAVLFAMIQRYHNLVATPPFPNYSPDLQAIELNRVLAPLIARLNSEGYRAPEFTESIEGQSAEQLMPKFRNLISALIE